MSTLLIPVTVASVFVAGCLAIHALQEWAELVRLALGWIFAAVVILLAAEAISNRMPRQARDAGVALSPSLTMSHQTTGRKE